MIMRSASMNKALSSGEFDGARVKYNDLSQRSKGDKSRLPEAVASILEDFAGSSNEEWKVPVWNDCLC